MLKLLLLILLVEPSAALIQNEPIQGGLTALNVEPQWEIYQDGVKIPNYNGKAFIGFGRDAKATTKLKITDPNLPSPLEIELPVTQREYNTQHINNLDKKKVNPPQLDWDRIKKENARIGYVRTKTSKECPEDLSFIVPVTKSTVTGVYGSQRVLNGQPKRPHFGIDYAAPTGTPIISPADGKVVLTADDMFYTGGTIGIDHGCGLVSIFSHLETVDVSRETIVKQGDVVGTVGSTGRSTGPHLDWRVNLGKTRLDPALVLKYFGKK